METKVMVNEKTHNPIDIAVNSNKLEWVDKFKYLGAWMNKDG